VLTSLILAMLNVGKIRKSLTNVLHSLGTLLESEIADWEGHSHSPKTRKNCCL